jgi:hypothetical protein
MKLTWRHTFDGFPLRAAARSSELQLSSAPSAPSTIPSVLLAGGSFAIVSCEYLVSELTLRTGSLLTAGPLVSGYLEFSVQCPMHYFIASESASWLDTRDWHLFEFPCSAFIATCLPYPHETAYYRDPKETLPLNSIRISCRPSNQYAYAKIQCIIVWRPNYLAYSSHCKEEKYFQQKRGGDSTQGAPCTGYFVKGEQMEVIVFCLTGQTILNVSSKLLVLAKFLVQAKELDGMRMHLSDLSGAKLVGKCCLDWQFVHSASVQHALLWLIDSGNLLDYTDLWWLTMVIITEVMSIVSTRFPVQKDVSGSVQTKSMLTPAYPLSSFDKEQASEPLFSMDLVCLSCVLPMCIDIPMESSGGLFLIWLAITWATVSPTPHMIQTYQVPVDIHRSVRWAFKSQRP